MKVIIFDGLDNTGKSTQIKLLSDYMTYLGKKVCVKHFSMPPADMSNADKAEYQNNAYKEYAKELMTYNKENVYDYVFIDRCWYSEYVYGQLYRERDELDLLMNMYCIEESLIVDLGINNIFLFMFSANKADFLVKNEDGYSISKGNINKIKKEMKIFNNIISLSKLYHIYNVCIDNGKGSFHDKECIAENIKTLLRGNN